MCNNELEQLKNNSKIKSISLCKYVFQNNSTNCFVDIEYFDKEKVQKIINEDVYNSCDVIEKCAEIVSCAKSICTKQIK